MVRALTGDASETITRPPDAGEGTGLSTCTCTVWVRGLGFGGVWCVVWCVVCGVWCVVCGVWCVVCGVWCVVCSVWCVVFGVVASEVPLSNESGTNKTVTARF